MPPYSQGSCWEADFLRCFHEFSGELYHVANPDNFIYVYFFILHITELQGNGKALLIELFQIYWIDFEKRSLSNGINYTKRMRVQYNSMYEI